jgi:triacylglycerol lipase
LDTIEIPQVNGEALVVYHQNLDALVIAFRGSKTAYDYYMDAQFGMSIVDFFPPELKIKIHGGFLKVYQAMRELIFENLERHSIKHKTIILTGHSLGGVLATVSAVDYHFRSKKRAQVVTFGQPRVGNAQFADWVNMMHLDIKRIAVYGDIVPFLAPEWYGYKHTLFPYLIKDGVTYRCVPDCDNEYKLDFKLHEVGYFNWNTTILAC